MPPKYSSKHTTYDLVAYYDNVINHENHDMQITRTEFQDELVALAEGKRLAADGVYMFEIFAKVTYEEGGRKVTNKVNTVRWVNFRQKNNAFLN
jgi:hypothetical protein